MRQGIFYLRQDEKVARILLKGVMDLKKVAEGEFEGEEKELNFTTGKYDVTKIHVLVKSVGELGYTNKLVGFKYVLRNVSWNGLTILGHQTIEKLTDEERQKMVHISLNEIQAVLKEAYKKGPSKWSEFEVACKKIRDKEDRYFVPVRRPKYETIPTGDVKKADIEIEINKKKYLVTEGTLAESVDCDDKGAMWYRFTFWR